MVTEDVVNKKLCRLRRRDALPHGGQTHHLAITTHKDQGASVATPISGKLEDEVHAHARGMLYRKERVDDIDWFLWKWPRPRATILGSRHQIDFMAYA
ncbi:unnamed protein product [Phytophthora fragariaefolia]|uniref:Unnamed protein product n=1 Tax=Phytophthora fragariaefolia TaxID=1490495 RepID=A0A9W6UCM7_9STRA|nr:unnamed protein product [Phytophthora fragariaefolia]